MDSNALQMMFSNGMQGLGAMQLGASNALAQQGDQAKLRAMQMENDQNAVMNPLNAQFKQGQIAAQQAELPGLGGISQQQIAKGKVATATADSDIAESISKSAANIGENGMKQMGQDANKIGQAAAVLKQFPAETHAKILPKILEQYGMSTNNPMVQQLLNAPDPSFIVPAIEKISRGMATASQQYLANSGQQEQAQTFKQKELDQTLGSHEKIAAANNVTSIQVANIQAESRKAAAEAKAKAMAANMGIDKAIAHIEMQGNAASDEDKETLRRLQEYKLTEKAAGAPAVAQTVLDQKTPTQVAKDSVPAKRAAPDPQGVDGLNHMTPEQKAKFDRDAQALGYLRPGSQPGRSAVNPDPQVAKEIQSQGMQYEPEKYEYKKIDGVWKRRQK